MRHHSNLTNKKNETAMGQFYFCEGRRVLYFGVFTVAQNNQHYVYIVQDYFTKENLIILTPLS
jgi:hypothetical protein